MLGETERESRQREEQDNNSGNWWRSTKGKGERRDCHHESKEVKVGKWEGRKPGNERAGKNWNSTNNPCAG